MNIFLGVYACEPNNGSEPEVGWQMVNEIAKAMPNDNIFAITKKNNKEAIDKETYPKNIKFFYYQAPKWLTFWKNGGRGIRTYYYLWQIGAALYMKKQNIKFDIIHHITFVNDWLPSFYFLLKNKNNKFIWGPIGSHDPIDNKFIDGRKRKIVEKIRVFLQLFFRNFDPSFYFCKKKADCIIGINDNVKEKLKLDSHKIFIAEPAIGIRRDVIEQATINEKESNDFTIISVGRLLYIKNFKLTILSFAKFLENNPSITDAKLQIVGEGKDSKSLEDLVKKLNISSYVEFTGNIPLAKVQEKFSKADLFLFPTLENAGFVTLEAMSNSLPVLAMKYGGPEQFIKNSIDNQLVSAEQEYNKIVDSLSEKIELFYRNKNLAKEIGKQNRQDILNHFTWEAKAQKMKKLYRKLINEA